ncbi:hypothetical protein BGZ46_006240, partial [Entomortierella lignicola]
MSRLLSSATSPFGQGAYVPLVDSRQSVDLAPDEEDLDPDSISKNTRRRQHSLSNADNANNSNNQRTHVLLFDAEEEDKDHHRGENVSPDDFTLREASDDSNSTIVPIEPNNDGSGSPPPKYRRQSFDFVESGPDGDHHRNGLDSEAFLGSTGDDDSSEKGLWMQ